MTRPTAITRWTDISTKTPLDKLIQLINRRFKNVDFPEDDAAPEVIQASQSFARFRYHGGSSLAAPCCSSSDTVTPGTGPGDTSNCLLWLRGSSLVESLADAASVDFWRDDSGNANHATNGVAGRSPILKINIVNGHPVARFDNTNDEMVTPLTRGAGEACTIYIVYAARIAGEAVLHSVLHGTDSFSNSLYFGWHNNHRVSGQWPAGGGNPISGGAVSANVFNVFSYTRPTSDAGTSTYYQNNTSQGTLTGNLTNFGTMYVGNSTYPAYADIAEVIVYSVVHGSTDLATVAQYLGTKYAITVA